MALSNLKTKYMTRNDCYTAGRKIKPKGIMLHSTATPGVMAADWFRRWNKSYKAGETSRQVCVHAFLDDKEAWQYLPWNHRGWHCGGVANNTHIGIEMCEPSCIKYTGGATFTCSDTATAKAEVTRTYNAAVELFAYLCNKFNLDPIADGVIISHSEGHKRGVASNHADPEHLWNQLNMGYTMNTFRAVVKEKMENKNLSDTIGDITGNYPEKLSTGYYRVRKSWKEKNTQLGAYRVLDNAKAQADKNPGYHIFSDSGVCIYPISESVNYRKYTVVKGDSLWDIAQKLLGSGIRYTEIKAFNNLTSNTIYSGQILKIPN